MMAPLDDNVRHSKGYILDPKLPDTALRDVMVIAELFSKFIKHECSCLYRKSGGFASLRKYKAR